MQPLSGVSSSAVATALTQAGIEIYRIVDAEIQVAERIRLHIMDSGIRVHTGDALSVVFNARSQRSDYPHMSADELLALVRGAIGVKARERGFEEQVTASREIRDPANDEHVLDVWHEVAYCKQLSSLDSLVDDVRWALELDKYVSE